jgi:hypothetical protein
MVNWHGTAVPFGRRYRQGVIRIDNPWRDGPAILRVGRFSIASYRKSLPDDILALFRDTQWVPILSGADLFNELHHDYELVAPIAQVSSRLALYGITGASVDKLLLEICHSFVDELENTLLSDTDTEWFARWCASQYVVPVPCRPCCHS